MDFKTLQHVCKYRSTPLIDKYRDLCLYDNHSHSCTEDMCPLLKQGNNQSARELASLFRSLYFICSRSENHNIIIDEETLKCILDKLKELEVT